MAPKAEKLLEPYLAGGDMRPNGDLDLHCPLHEDKRRSAAVNFVTREWYCNACEAGGSLQGLLDQRADWFEPPKEAGGWSGKKLRARDLPDPARMEGWEQRLLSNEGVLEYLETRRGISMETIQRYNIGWDGTRITLPVRDDAGVVQNIRCYSNTLEPKIINWPGHGSPPRLYPMEVLLRDPKVIFVCEGEFDALLGNQQGIACVTATAGAKQLGRWRGSWDPWFRQKVVFICTDRDRDGELAARRIAKKLEKVARRISIVELPFEMGTGKDLSDFILDGGSVSDLRKKFGKRPKAVRRAAPRYHEQPYESMHEGQMIDKPSRFEATLAVIYDRQHSLPRTLHANCNMDWDPKRCAVCPLGQADGKMSEQVEHNSDLLLDLMASGNSEVTDRRFKRELKIPQNCPEVEIKADWMTVWPAEVRNGSNLQEESFPILLMNDKKAPSVNRPYWFSGIAHPNPRGHKTTFLARKIELAQQDIDNFVADAYHSKLAREWIEQFDGPPEARLEAISKMFESRVTRIFAQRELHMAMDVVYHSVLKFKFGEVKPERGWMELLAVGETRSGKSTAAQQLIELYEQGHLCSGENTTVAGLLGGLEKKTGFGSEGAWAISVGELPLCHRRLIVIDEAQGLDIGQIGKMSDVRSRGVVNIQKIRSGSWPSQVRIIWLANARKFRYKHKIEALHDQMGQAEDLARVDIPLWLVRPRDDDVNRTQEPYDELTQDERNVIRWIVLWAWSRKPEQIVWKPTTVETLYRLREDLVNSYSINEFPIFPESEAHVRLARMAVAIAARLYSTDDGENLVVRAEHVGAAHALYDLFLKDAELGITDIKEEDVAVETAEDNYSEDLSSLLHDDNPEIRLKLAEGEFDRFEWGSFSENTMIMTQLRNMGAIQKHPTDRRLHLVSKWAQDLAKQVDREMRGV
jgi:hypothetical protein